VQALDTAHSMCGFYLHVGVCMHACMYVVHGVTVLSFPLVQLVQILLKKFCVTDNPKKFSLYEEYGGDCESGMVG
jgi:hypothetical protein